jgi:hypothetical protein
MEDKFYKSETRWGVTYALIDQDTHILTGNPVKNSFTVKIRTNIGTAIGKTYKTYKNAERALLKVGYTEVLQ